MTEPIKEEKDVDKQDLKQESEESEVPIVEEDFAKLLQKFKIKAPVASNIAENISHTGGQNVFEEPALLSKRLTAWSSEIAPAKRKLILEQWFAEKGVEVPADLIEKAGMTPDQLKKAETSKAKQDEVRYVYDTASKQIRMANEEERGGTFDQAKQLKDLAEESESAGKESPFIPDGQGGFTLNPKARITGIELMAFESIKRSQESGQPIDPLDALAMAADKMKLYRDVLGGGGGQTLPSWISDPGSFVQLVRDISGAGQQDNRPSWMSDPAEFVKVIREVAGSDKEGDDKVSAEIATLRQTVSDLREDAHKNEITRLNDSIQAQAQEHTRQIQGLASKIDEMGKPQTGRTEMDIIHEVAHEGIGVIKTEAAGMRTMLREIFTPSGAPPVKSAQDRNARKDRFRQALNTNEEIDQLGQSLFFAQS